MQIDIQARNFSLTQALRSYIERRLAYALGTRDEHIQRILVRLSDINGPRGGEDKCCHIQVVLPRLSDVIIEDIEVDMYAAIDRATDRAGRTVGRKLARQRHNDRVAGLASLQSFSEEQITDEQKVETV
ncbi:MAG: HPF/RaiA family ribosome-associated protein [Gammaproteobacteria bacterium]|nr:HPF/RaiA family ribosome-associated protein [Gammaproteobacteria bacterium]